MRDKNEWNLEYTNIIIWWGNLLEDRKFKYVRNNFFNGKIK